MKITISILFVLHLVVALWHGDAHSTLGIQLSFFQTLYVYLIILGAPVVGVILVWSRFMLVGIGLFAISMAGALVFAVCYHYILVSPDNIAHLPVGTAVVQAQFIDSAALIAIMELLSTLFGFSALGYTYADKNNKV